MTQITQSASAFSAPTKSFEQVVGETGTATSRTRCQVFAFADYDTPQPEAPAKYTSISDLVSELERDSDAKAAIEDGRRWIADSFYGQDGDTVRNMRLRKGWSQTRLAEELGTSQSHVARIEQGTQNLSIETCRKLSEALGIDLNTLDQALQRQEAIAIAKQK